jgi:hypothetical protein
MLSSVGHVPHGGVAGIQSCCLLLGACLLDGWQECKHAVFCWARAWLGAGGNAMICCPPMGTCFFCARQEDNHAVL